MPIYKTHDCNVWKVFITTVFRICAVIKQPVKQIIGYTQTFGKFKLGFSDSENANSTTSNSQYSSYYSYGEFIVN